MSDAASRRISTAAPESWVPQDCTLPTVEQPLRQAEFDDLFENGLLGQQRLSPTRLQWQLKPSAESTARALAEREASCCSFFTFTFTTSADLLTVDVDVPAAQSPVLDAIAQRAEVRIQS